MGGPHKSTSFGLIALHSWMSSSSARISSSVTPSLSSTASIGEGWLKPNCQTAHERGIQSIAGSRWCETARGASQGRPTRIQAMATACRMADTYTCGSLSARRARDGATKRRPWRQLPAAFQLAIVDAVKRIAAVACDVDDLPLVVDLPLARRWRHAQTLAFARLFSLLARPEALIDTVAVVPNMPPHRTRATCTACAG